jgi:hypothetical protein
MRSRIGLPKLLFELSFAERHSLGQAFFKPISLRTLTHLPAVAAFSLLALPRPHLHPAQVHSISQHYQRLASELQLYLLRIDVLRPGQRAPLQPLIASQNPVPSQQSSSDDYAVDW